METSIQPLFETLATHQLPWIMMLSTRIGTALILLPPPFGAVAPMRTRVALSLLLAFAIGVPNVGGFEPLDLSPLGVFRAGVGEALLGSVMGLTVRLTMAAADVAGTFTGFTMGLGFATSIDPNLGEQVLPTTRLLSQFATLIFLIIGGHHMVLHALAHSATLFPPGQAIEIMKNSRLLNLGGDLLAQGLRISSPVVATMFIVQVGTALISRAAPRVHIFALSFAVVSATGILTLLVSAPSLATSISVHLRNLPEALASSLGGW